MFKIKKISIKEKHGQQVIEYALLLAAVIVVAVLFFARGGPFNRSMNTVMDDTLTFIDVLSTNFIFNANSK